MPGPAVAQQPSGCAGRGPRHANGLVIVDRERSGRASPGEPLLTVRPDGRRVRRLSSPGRRQFDGALYAVAASPDGRWATFVRRSGDVDTVKLVYRMAPDGTRLRRLARVRTAGDAAVFSPDGRLLAYNDRRGTMIRPVAGGRARRLLTGLWVKAWAPRPR